MEYNRWSLIGSWSIACQGCSNYIFILNLTPGFNGLGRVNCKMRRESFKCWDLVRLILEILRYLLPIEWMYTCSCPLRTSRCWWFLRRITQFLAGTHWKHWCWGTEEVVPDDHSSRPSIPRCKCNYLRKKWVHSLVLGKLKAVILWA